MAVDTEESSGAAALDTAVAYLREDVFGVRGFDLGFGVSGFRLGFGV